MRDDVFQDIWIAVRTGLVQLETLAADPATVRRFVTTARKLNHERAGYAISLDQPMRDGRSWHDVLTVAPDERE